MKIWTIGRAIGREEKRGRMSRYYERYKLADVEHLSIDTCPDCGGVDFTYRSVGNSVRAYCLSELCHFSRSVPLLKNLDRRTNTTLAHWSAQVRKRHGYTCARCGSQTEVEAHHVVPVCVAPSKKYDAENGVALCRTCHKLIHKNMEVRNDLRRNADHQHRSLT